MLLHIVADIKINLTDLQKNVVENKTFSFSFIYLISPVLDVV